MITDNEALFTPSSSGQPFLLREETVCSCYDVCVCWMAIRRPKSVLARTCQEGGVAKNRAPTISCRIILSRTHWIDSRGSIEFHPLVQTRMFMDFGVEWKSWIYRDVEIVHKTLHCGSQHSNKAIAREWYLRGEFLLPYKFEFVIHLLVDGRNSPHDTLIGN